MRRFLIWLGLLAYPRVFRNRHGTELVRALNECLRRERSRRGWISTQIAQLSHLTNFLMDGLRERGAARVQRMLPSQSGGRNLQVLGSAVMQDVRFAVRTMLKQPVFTLVALGSLALGIGAITSIFSIANSLFFRPPSGITHADRVVELGRTIGGRGFDTFAYPDFLDLREEVTSLDRLTAWSVEPVSFSMGGEGERIAAMVVSANYFEMLGVRQGLGRYFLPEEDLVPAEPAVVVLSHDFWQNRFGGSTEVIGSTIFLNRHAFTVVGVAPEGFRGHLTGIVPHVWVPFMMRPVTSPGWNDFEVRNSSSFFALGRLAEGSTIAEAEAAVQTVYARLQQQYPETHARTGNERSARLVMLGPVPGAGRNFVAAFVGSLAALVTMVLLITCTNVAGMVLARGAAREKEIAMRLALGSGRLRLIGQLLTESLLLFMLGGAFGVLLANAVLSAVSAVQLNTFMPLSVDVRPDSAVLLFALGTTLLTGSVFGLLPALKSTTLELVPSLKHDISRGNMQGGLMRRLIVASQLGLSLVLLVSAGLFVRSLFQASKVDKGFNADHVYLTTFDLSLEGYENPAEGRAFQRELLARIRKRPDVESAALAIDLPLDLSSHGEGGLRPEGWESMQESEWMGADINRVSTGYFGTLQIPLVHGRDFDGSDRNDALPVAIVSEAFAARAWPGADAIGRTIAWSNASRPAVTVVAVVGDVLNQTINEDPNPMVYLPLAQQYASTMNLIVRETPGTAIAGQLASLVLEQDPRISITPVVSMTDHTGVATLPQRIGAWITTALGLVALVLSGLGVYGVISFAVSRRIHEIGIRMALGAESGEVARMVVGSAVRIAAPGLIVGALIAAILGSFLKTFLLGVSPLDPATLTAVAGLLAILIVLSSWVPARRAAGVNPVDALRSE